MARTHGGTGGGARSGVLSCSSRRRRRKRRTRSTTNTTTASANRVTMAPVTSSGKTISPLTLSPPSGAGPDIRPSPARPMTTLAASSAQVRAGPIGSRPLPGAAGEIETGIRGANAGLREAQLPADDVGALDEGDTLVVRDPAAQPLAPEAAIGRDDQPLGRNVLERLANQPGHVLGRLHDGVAVG